MPTDPRKRQKKVERRTAKRKEKKHQLVRAQPSGMAERLQMATRYPVLHSVITDSVWESGMGSVIFSRAVPDGTVAFAVFLIDRCCLGVKNALFAVLPKSVYESKYHRGILSRTPGPDVPPEKARRFVEAAVEYAHALGFAPHPDYLKAKLIFGDVDASACTEDFEFGKDGKPYFTSGPNDSQARCRQIINTLMRTCGEGNFHFMMGVDPDRMILDDFDMDAGDEVPEDLEELSDGTDGEQGVDTPR
jgi:hypothetical protein